MGHTRAPAKGGDVFISRRSLPQPRLTKDPTQAWRRPQVDLGVLTIDKTVADSAAAQKLLFLPGRLTDGIEPSDDPLIAARDGSYAVSFGRHTSW
jgi:catalase